jgi:hypothetical protein
MMVVGVIKLIESNKNATIVSIDEEKGLLLEPSNADNKAEYGAAITLQSQGSNSF